MVGVRVVDAFGVVYTRARGARGGVPIALYFILVSTSTLRSLQMRGIRTLDLRRRQAIQALLTQRRLMGRVAAVASLSRPVFEDGLPVKEGGGEVLLEEAAGEACGDRPGSMRLAGSILSVRDRGLL